MLTIKGILKKENQKILLKYFLLGIVIIQALAIFLFNLLQTENFLFSDNACAIRHGMEIWRNGLFIEGYNYLTSMEIDCASFFAVPLYFLTGNLGLSLAIVHLLLYILCAVLVCSIFRNMDYDLSYGLLAVFLIFTPYVIGGLDWANMLFLTVGQYQFRVMVLLSVTNLLLMTLKGKGKEGKFLPFLIFHLILCAWTTLSCGNYVLLMIILPFCLFYGFINLISEKWIINKGAIVVLASSMAVCLITLIIRNQAIGETGRGSLELLTADTFTANLLNCITGFFMLFGGLGQEADLAIFSAKGILQVLKFGFIVLCLIIAVIRLKKSKADDYLHFMFAFVALVNLAVMLLLVTRYGAIIFEHRYHIIWGIMLLLVTVASVDSILLPKLRGAVWIAITGIAILINIGGFDRITEEIHYTDYEREIIEVADREELNTIYLYNMPDDAAVIRVLDMEKSCMSVTYVVDHVYNSTNNYIEDYSRYYTYDEQHLFVCSRESFDLLPEEIRNCYNEIGILGDNLLFVSHENPWLWESIK